MAQASQKSRLDAIRLASVQFVAVSDIDVANTSSGVPGDIGGFAVLGVVVAVYVVAVCVVVVAVYVVYVLVVSVLVVAVDVELVAVVVEVVVLVV